MKLPSRGYPLVLAALAAPTMAQSCQPYWSGVGSPLSLHTQPGSLAVFDDGEGSKLYAVGSIPFSAGQRGVARWDGRSWEFVTQGLPHFNIVLNVMNFSTGPRLYAAGQLQTVRVGSFWNGSEWEPDTSGMSSVGWAHLVFDDGSGEAVWGIMPGQHFNNLAVGRWDGSQWSIIGEANPNLSQMIVYDDGSGPKLHVSGSFSNISGVPANRIARWTGTAWEPLGTGVGPDSPRDMVVHDDGSGPALFVANVTSAGGQWVDWIARWDGQNWSNIGGGGINTVGIVTLHGLGTFDDGTGPALFVGGWMSYVGSGIPVRAVARYKDGIWDNMLGGVGGSGIARAFATYDDGRGPSLFVGGGFNTAGAGAPGATIGIAQFVGCPNCYANCTNRQTEPRLTVDDFTCFIDKFAYGDPYVDCNQDGQRTIDDFHCFIARFAEGCP